MRIQRFAIGLTVVNLLLLLIGVARMGPVVAQTAAPVLRGQAIELVDEKGQVRAQLNVEPDGETVFRMRDAAGTIRVKMGASKDGQQRTVRP